jgi:hypothetical protein
LFNPGSGQVFECCWRRDDSCRTLAGQRFALSACCAHAYCRHFAVVSAHARSAAEALSARARRDLFEAGDTERGTLQCEIERERERARLESLLCYCFVVMLVEVERDKTVLVLLFVFLCLLLREREREIRKS